MTPLPPGKCLTKMISCPTKKSYHINQPIFQQGVVQGAQSKAHPSSNYVNTTCIACYTHSNPEKVTFIMGLILLVHQCTQQDWQSEHEHKSHDMSTIRKSQYLVGQIFWRFDTLYIKLWSIMRMDDMVSKFRKGGGW